MSNLSRTLTPYVLWYGLCALVLALCLTPLQGGLPTPIVQSADALSVMKLSLLLLTPLGVWLALRTPRFSVAERRIVWGLCLLSAAVCEIVHYWAIDQGHYFPVSMFASNTAWQRFMHRGILALDPGYLPHSYRFLPDCIVELFIWLCGDFEFSRLAYRLLADSILFAVVYRYARLYLTSLSSAAVILLVVMVYPVTILRYAGQFVDPASHLSFAVCLYALAAGYEPAFGPSLLLGIFAKESIVVMAVCRAFYGPGRARAIGLAALYVGAGLAVALGIRLVVNQGTFSYGKVSGVQWDHVVTNLSLYPQWGPLYLLSIGVFVPGAVLGWRYMDRAFKATTVLVTVAVVVSSLIFSWLAEVRNLVPAFFPLAIASLKYVEVRLSGLRPFAGGARSSFQ